MRRPARLTGEQRTLLSALRRGCQLKIHRTLDGAKVYRLHAALGRAEGGDEVVPAVAESLERLGYIRSNMKFPAATLLLTEQGIAATGAPADADLGTCPVGPRAY